MLPKTRKLAVCDLGTNIWRLRIIDTANYTPPITENGQNPTTVALLSQMLKDSILLREGVFMAREGSSKMSDATILRCKNTLRLYKAEMDKHALTDVWIAATAGFRKAQNALEFVDWAAAELGLTIEIITGDYEAELLATGIRAALQPIYTTNRISENALFIDIGGGSVEYIISTNEKTLWAKSFPIGVNVLYEKFGKTTVFSESEKNEIFDFINKTLHELPDIIQQYQPQRLAMTAGTFGVLYALLGQKRPENSFDIIKKSDFEALYASLMAQTHSVLYKNPLIPDHRVEFLQVCLFLIAQATKLLPVTEIITPRWSMEEGMLLQLLNAE